MKKDIVTIDDFEKIDIRVGSVLDAKPVSNSKKLIRLTVDLGIDYGVVTILTGLLSFFPDPSLLIGNKYLFLANLAPRTMAGVESQGMFLAIDSNGIPLPLALPSDTLIGTHVH